MLRASAACAASTVAVAEQQAGAHEMQAGLVRLQRDRAIDAGQRRVDIAGQLLRGGQQFQRLRVFRIGGDRGVGGGQRLRGVAAAQGFEDGFVHERIRWRAPSRLL